jgi:hypothetical protein
MMTLVTESTVKVKIEAVDALRKEGSEVTPDGEGQQK